MTRPLTDAERRALTILSQKAAEVIRHGHKLGRLQISYPTAERLLVNGWARAVVGYRNPSPAIDGCLVITAAGRAALAVPVPDEPVYLHARDGLTTEPNQAAAGEPEVIDPATLSAYWRERALTRSLGAKPGRDRAKKHRNLRRTRKDAA